MAKKTHSYVLAIPCIRIDCGDHHKKLIRGDSCDGVPAGTLEVMLRLKQAVPESEYEAMEPTIDPEIEPESEPESPDWTAIGLGGMGLSASTFKTLNAAGLHTAGDILEYGSKNDGLTSINGVGDSTEKEIQAALEKLA